MLSDACHEFLTAFGELAQALGESAHHYSAPAGTIQYGEEIDALRRACVRVSTAPDDTEAGANLLRLALSVLRYHDTPPSVPELAERKKEMLALVRLLQQAAEQDQTTAVLALVEDIVVEGPRAEAAALKLRGILSRLGKPTYDVAVKIVADVGSATVKRLLGL